MAEDNTIKILVATDIHVGYMEKDAVRGNDSLITFEEILMHGKSNDVDMILLGGDLFHDNKPSRQTLHGVMALLRKYCLGDRPCQLEYLSDQAVDYGHTPFPVVNYEDPNLNVSYPVFSIHGNHDDPTGTSQLCSLDLLSAAGLINYFGKQSNLEQINVCPVLLRKGNTSLAMYGIGSIRDERLHRMFLRQDVSMLRPREGQEDWFNLLVLHQNRAKHGPTNYIREDFLDNFLDLVIWGHEHECLIDPSWNDQQRLFISQPGSSVATSLSEGETKPKHIGLLMIKEKQFKMKKIKLETVRPFYMEDISLSNTDIKPDDYNVCEQLENYCVEKVESLVEKAEFVRMNNSKTPDKPLIRLRIDYSGGFYDLFNTHRFGQRFVGIVANPEDMVMFHRRRDTNKQKSEGTNGPDITLPVMKVDGIDIGRVEDMVKLYFSQSDQKDQLEILTEKGLGEAVKEYVDKEENDAIFELVKYQLGKTQDHLSERKTNEDRIPEDVKKFREIRKKRIENEKRINNNENIDEQTQEDQEIIEALKLAKGHNSTDKDDKMVISDDDEHRGSKNRGRGRGRGRGGTRGRGSRGGRGKNKAPVVHESSTRPIKDAFMKKKTKKAVAIDTFTSSSDSESIGKSSSTRRTVNPSGTSQGNFQRLRKGVVFDSSSEDDEVSFIVKRRR